jgi:uncharacterized membrane protein (DUF4010 family)
MDFQDLLSRIALAFGIGLLIGLERGWRTREARAGSRAAGVRTFALSGLLGGFVAALSRNAVGDLSTGGSVLLGATFIAYAFVIAVFNRDENKASGSASATTTVAALLTFILGAYAVVGDVRVAAAAAVVAVGVLIVRESLHAWIARITLVELEAGLMLLAMTLIALPVIPDKPFDYLGGANPREIWIIAIVLASVSFAGYVSSKLFGEGRGILIAAAAGGLVSSTVVAFTYARRAASGEGSPILLAAGTALASAVSFIRVAAIVAVLAPSMLLTVAPALTAAALISAASALATIYWRNDNASSSIGLNLRNPFAFWSVVGAAITMGALIIAGRFIAAQFGAQGAIAGAAAMGLFDVDAMVVSITKLVPTSLALNSGAFAILTGVAANVLSKATIAAALGGRVFAIGYGGISIVTLLGAWLVAILFGSFAGV